jgi:hypothetical protein
MKKLCTLFAVSLMLLACGNLQAQTKQPTEFAKKGTILFNPQLLNLGYSSLSFKVSGSENTDLNQFGLAVSGGYAIQDNLFILGQVGAQSFKFGEMNFSFFSLGGGVRYYLPNNFYAGAGLLLNSGKIKGVGDMDFEDVESDTDFEDVESDLSTTMIEFRLEAGYSYFLLPSVALEPSISYGTKILGGKIEDYDDKLKYSRFGINLGVSIFF